MCAGGNEWINRLKEAGGDDLAEAKAKANGKGKSELFKDPSAVEPKHATFAGVERRRPGLH
eukprot:444605-Pyramimonas_sp.AAC.1